jgi:thymidine kinase
MTFSRAISTLFIASATIFSTPNLYSTGKLEVICGSMFAGKSEELIRRLRRAQIAQQKVICFNNRLDTRYDNTTTIRYIVSHNGNKITAQPIEDERDIIRIATESQLDVVGIDEVQFFSKDIVTIIQALVDRGIHVIVSGLDLDFKAEPFGHMPILLTIADEITKLHAICTLCGQDAYVSQRLINNKPAKYNDPIVMVGAQEAYQARCRACFIIDKANPIINNRAL